MGISSLTERQENLFIPPEESVTIANDIQIDGSKPIHEVLEQCKEYLSSHKDMRSSIYELMEEIDELLSNIKRIYINDFGNKQNGLSSYRIRQDLKIPLYAEFIREISALYKIAPRRYLLRYLSQNGYDVVTNHIETAEVIDEESLKNYLNNLIALAKNAALENNYAYDDATSDLLRRLMEDNANIEVQDVLKIGYALKWDAAQVSNFGARVLACNILPVTTHEGLIHRFCLDTKKSYDDARKLLAWYNRWHKKRLAEGKIQPKTIIDRKSEHTKKAFENYVNFLEKSKDCNDFKLFLKIEAPFLDVGSKTALNLYRILAAFYLFAQKNMGAIPNMCAIPESPKDMQFTLLYLLSLSAAENPTVPNQLNWTLREFIGFYLAIDWQKDAVRISEALLETMKSGYQYFKEADNWQKIKERLHANLSTDSSIKGRKGLLEKKDVLLILYYIVRATQTFDRTNAECATFADVFWYIGDRFLKELGGGCETGWEFYLPATLESSLMLSISCNLPLDDLWDCRKKEDAAGILNKFLHDPNATKEQRQFADAIVKEALLEIADAETDDQIDKIIRKVKDNIQKFKLGTSEAPNPDPPSPPVPTHFNNILRHLRDKYIQKISSDLSDLKPLISELGIYFSGKTCGCKAFFDDVGVWPSHPVDESKKDTTAAPIFKWDSNILNTPLTENLGSRKITSIATESKTIGELAKETVDTAKSTSGYTPPNEEKKVDETANFFLLMLINKEIQAQYPNLNLEFRVNAVKEKMITLTASRNIRKRDHE